MGDDIEARRVVAFLQDRVSDLERRFASHVADEDRHTLGTIEASPMPSQAAERWPLYEIDTDDVCTLEGFDGVGLMTGDVRDGLRMSRETARALAERILALLGRR